MNPPDRQEGRAIKLSYDDRRHAYWLNGQRCMSVTTVAKIPDDTYALNKWRQRQVVIGMATSPSLVTRAAAHFDERGKIDEIAEEAMVAAKAHEAAGRGTAAHRVTERIDLGLDWIDTPEARLVRQQWTAALDHAGLDIVPELVERIVVYPDELVAGRFDRIARRRSDGALVVVDIKTGENAIRYPHSTAVQLALYANAPLLAGPLERRGQSEVTEQFEPLPDELDRSVGIIVYLPPDGAAKIYEIDLTAGWQTATGICFPTIAWRKRTGLITELGTAEPAAPAVVEKRLEWLRARVVALKDAGHLAAVAASWPDGVPTLKQGGLTDPDIDKIAAVLDRIEADHGIPFGPTDPLFDLAGDGNQPIEAPAQDAAPADPSVIDPAKAHTEQALALLDLFDPPEANAIRDLVIGPTPRRTTAADVTHIGAVINEIADPNGAVMFKYGPNGPEIVATNAKDRVRRGGTKTAALSRAKKLAKSLDRPVPRTFDQVCADPLLAALVAAGIDAETIK